MRKRDRWAGAVWLVGFEDHKSTTRVLPDAEDYNVTVQMSVELLTGWGYMIELQGRVGNYTLRLLPISTSAITTPQMPAASYCGARLRQMLAAAVYEIEAIMLGQRYAALSNRERVRWVGP